MTKYLCDPLKYLYNTCKPELWWTPQTFRNCFKLAQEKMWCSPSPRHFVLLGFLVLQDSTLCFFPPFLYCSLLAVFRLLLTCRKTFSLYISHAAEAVILNADVFTLPQNAPWRDYSLCCRFPPRSQTPLWTGAYPCWCRSLRALWWGMLVQAHRTLDQERVRIIVIIE